MNISKEIFEKLVDEHRTAIRIAYVTNHTPSWIYRLAERYSIELEPTPIPVQTPCLVGCQCARHGARSEEVRRRISETRSTHKPSKEQFIQWVKKWKTANRIAEATGFTSAYARKLSKMYDIPLTDGRKI